MSRTRAALTALTLIPVLLVAGCSDDDPKPKFEPPPSRTPTSSTSPTVPAPALNPEQTVEAWIDARNSALADGNLTQVRALTTATCKSCDGILDPISQVYDSGGKFDTDGWQIVASRIKSEKASRATVSAALKFAAGRTIPEAGAEPVIYGVEKHMVIFRLTQTNGTWVVNFIGFLS